MNRINFGRIVASIAGLFTKGPVLPRTREYPDPILANDHYGAALGRRRFRGRLRVGTRSSLKGKPRYRRPKAVPGTITFHDWLVRHYGYDRRKADLAQDVWLKTGRMMWAE